MDKLADAGILASMFAIVMGLIEVIKAQLKKRAGAVSANDGAIFLAEIASQLQRSNEIQERIIAKLDIVVERQAVNSERLCTIRRDLEELKRRETT